MGSGTSPLWPVTVKEHTVLPKAVLDLQRRGRTLPRLRAVALVFSVACRLTLECSTCSILVAHRVPILTFYCSLNRGRLVPHRKMCALANTRDLIPRRRSPKMRLRRGDEAFLALCVCRQNCRSTSPKLWRCTALIGNPGLS